MVKTPQIVLYIVSKVWFWINSQVDKYLDVDKVIVIRLVKYVGVQIKINLCL